MLGNEQIRNALNVPFDVQARMPCFDLVLYTETLPVKNFIKSHMNEQSK